MVDEATRDTASIVKSVFLFTDGEANHGITDCGQIINVMSNMLSGGRDRAAHAEDAASAPAGSSAARLKVHTFGFGEQHNSDMLEVISAAGNGTYYFIQSPENIPEAFADALGGLLSVCAQNVELRITPLNSAALKCVHTGFGKRQDGADTVVTMPDLFAEESKDVVLDLSLPRAADIELDADIDVAEVSMRFLDVLRGCLATKSVTITLHRALAPPAAAPDRAIAVHRARLATAARMREAIALADAGNHGAATASLMQQVATIDELLVREGSDASEELASEVGALQLDGTLRALRGDLQRCARQVRAPMVYASSGKKYASAQAAAHGCQRSVGLGYSASAPQAPRPQASRSRDRMGGPGLFGRATAVPPGGYAPPPGLFHAPAGPASRSVRGAPASSGLFGAAPGAAFGCAAPAPAGAGGGLFNGVQDAEADPAGVDEDFADMDDGAAEEPTVNAYATRLQRTLVEGATLNAADPKP